MLNDVTRMNVEEARLAVYEYSTGRMATLCEMRNAGWVTSEEFYKRAVEIKAEERFLIEAIEKHNG